MIQLTAKQIKEVINGMDDDCLIFAEDRCGLTIPITEIRIEHHDKIIIFKEQLKKCYLKQRMKQ